jgi:hypothetical protein
MIHANPSTPNACPLLNSPTIVPLALMPSVNVPVSRLDSPARSTCPPTGRIHANIRESREAGGVAAALIAIAVVLMAPVVDRGEPIVPEQKPGATLLASVYVPTISPVALIPEASVAIAPGKSMECTFRRGNGGSHH